MFWYLGPKTLPYPAPGSYELFKHHLTASPLQDSNAQSEYDSSLKDSLASAKGLKRLIVCLERYISYHSD